MNNQIQQRLINNSKKYNKSIKFNNQTVIFWSIVLILSIVVICLIIYLLYQTSTTGVLVSGLGTTFGMDPNNQKLSALFTSTSTNASTNAKTNTKTKTNTNKFQNSGQSYGNDSSGGFTSAAAWGNSGRTAIANQELSQILNGDNPNASFMGQNMRFNLAPNPDASPNLLNPIYSINTLVGSLESVPEAEFYDNMNGGGYVNMLTPQFNERAARQLF